MEYALSVSQLKKSYGTHLVLDGLDFKVQKGEMFALLGVNGAGKTTALECIEGLRKYDGGTIVTNGKIGIQLQSSSLPAHIKALEAIRLFAKWHRAKIDFSMLQALGINEFKNQQYSQLSIGQKRRLHLSLSLLNDPDLLFLDEPTAGLDVEGRLALHEQIRFLKSRGKTIILASHDMEEVESLCEKIAILNHGKIVFCGTSLELTQRVGKKYLLHIETEQGKCTLETDCVLDTLLPLLEKLKQDNVALWNIQVDRGSLTQHFMELAK